jgi:hypothetical protein
MGGRLENVFEGLIMALIMCAIFFVVALIARLVFKKSIGNGKYYSVAVVLGFLISGVIIPAILKSEKIDSAVAAQPAAGLDAPFVAPPQDKMESFIPQLKMATDQLPPADRKLINDALAFLGTPLLRRQPSDLSDSGWRVHRDCCFRSRPRYSSVRSLRGFSSFHMREA